MKTLKTLLITTLLILSGAILYAQESGQTGVKSYLLDRFLITPQQKMISVRTKIGGDTWDGFTYVPDIRIVYDKTSLIILGDQIFFKEEIDIDLDFETLYIIENNEGKRIYADKNYIYHLFERELHQRIKISDYKTINDYIYQDKSGNLYFMHGI